MLAFKAKSKNPGNISKGCRKSFIEFLIGPPLGEFKSIELEGLIQRAKELHPAARPWRGRQPWIGVGQGLRRRGPPAAVASDAVEEVGGGGGAAEGGSAAAERSSKFKAKL